MKRQAIVMVGTIALFAAPLFAQAPAGAAAPSTAEAIRQTYSNLKNNILKAADKMPDDAYDFKPTPEERSFGGWIGHVVEAQNNGCARVQGLPPADLKMGPGTTKAALVASLKSSFDLCDAAYAALTDSNSNDTVQGFRGPATRLASLAGNVTHDSECYGAMAVYMRLKGIVPPSSEPRR